MSAVKGRLCFGGGPSEASRTVTFSRSASEEVGDKGLMGLREGELPTLDTYSGSGTYRTCKYNTALHTPQGQGDTHTHT